MANRLVFGFLALLLLIGVGLAGIWLGENFEPYTEQIRRGYSPEAQRNPWLAAERFLHRLGLDVESLAGREFLRSPPVAHGVLLVRDLGPSLPLSRQQALLEWVAAGSQLIITPPQLPFEADSPHRLLQHLGVSFAELETDQDQVTVKLALPGTAVSIDVAFDPARRLQLEDSTPLWQVPAGSGYHLLHLPYGAGAITLLSDNGFLSNSEIDKHDHALLLAYLVEGHTRAWLLYRSQMPSLLHMLWQQAPYLMLSMGWLLLSLLWWLTRRSGPLLVQAKPLRRDLLEHLEASAEFSWRQDRASQMQQGIRQRVEMRWLAVHPPLQRLPPAERCAWLAERTGLSRHAIHLALYTEQQEEQTLIRATGTLQRLLHALHPQRTME
jgi:hypothetical protein